MLDVGEEPGGQERRNAQMAIARMVLENWRQKLVSARANDKKSAVFDMKQAFSDKKTPFWSLRMPVRWRRASFRNDVSLPSSGVFQMIRRLLAASVIVAAVVLTACSDMTAPKHTTCPVTSGSSTCLTR
ncbi:MAG TPA: hypothetical protein VF850_09765 [Gemmatimonadaceae bacterium]